MLFVVEKERKRELAKRFHVSLSFIQRLIGRYLDTGLVEALPHKSGNPAKIKEEHYPILQKVVEENNDATLEELCIQMELKTKVKISRSGMCKTLEKLQLTRKKTLHAAEQDTERVKKIRQEYWENIRTIELNNLVFIDESDVNIAMTRLHARALKGERAHGSRPDKRGKM